MAVCGIWVLGGVSQVVWSKMFVPPSTLFRNRRNPVPYLPKIYTWKPVHGGSNSILNWALKLNNLLKYFEALNLVFACIHHEKEIKVMNFWCIYDASVLYSSKITRCGSMITFHACSLFSPLMHHHHQIFFHVVCECTIYRYRKSFLSLNK